MLQINGIKKQYVTGELVQTALDDVSLNFRDNEFVAILGPSGSGKTTLLNIVGGLDRYDSGDLIINGVSTKKYTDRDWDSYRNHTIGFVFQSYNLIPHQTILANVELALTISGISRAERKKRAIQALEQVGLGEQIHKKPNQMSGGQMQRVAIARALVNNPDILLADEPTGALDTETSVQVMDLLKEVAKDRLVIMVTHNPELAEEYATRIVKLRDGKIKDDNNPFDVDAEKLAPAEHKNLGKATMSFFTALSLSFNNLKTKKGRTILTAFAGSIGIIGIALILSLSTGVNSYIEDVQKDTMTSYPITIQTKTIDLTSLMTEGQNMQNGTSSTDTTNSDREGVFANNKALVQKAAMTTNLLQNNLTPFKEYLDDENSEIHKYLGENGIVYTYDVGFKVYSYDTDGTLVDTSTDASEVTDNTASGFSSGSSSSSASGLNMMSMVTGTGASSNAAKNFSEMMAGKNGDTVSAVVTDSYDLLNGKWPENYDEVVLVLNKNNSVSTTVMYQLGLITAKQYKTINDQINNNETPDEYSWNYDEILDHSFYMVTSSDQYIENADGTFTSISGNTLYNNTIINNSLKLKVVGVVRQNVSDDNARISGAVGYTSKLTDYIIEHTDNSAIIKAQQDNPDTNVLTGIGFATSDDEAKVSDAKKYITGMSTTDKATFYAMMMSQSSSAGSGSTSSATGGMTGAAMDENAMAAMLDAWVAGNPDETVLLSFYDRYLDGGSYKDNMKTFGKVSYDAPSSISLYVDSFDAKDKIAECITNYNNAADADNKITYTDYVALLTSSITQIVNVISYVLIAFVAVSLIVSSIMIGIITHISVMERTKEIGILRAIGASKKNISQVFNAETVIIGLCSGAIGVGVSMLITIPINAIIHALSGLTTVNAFLKPESAIILILISLVITVIGGLIPASNAAKKDPVIALRSE